MSIRLKAIVMIGIVVLILTTTFYFASLYFTNRSLTTAMEQDLSFAIEVADGLISTKIQLLKSNAAHIAERLLRAGSTGEMVKIMREHISNCPDCIAHSIFDREGIIAYSALPINSIERLKHREAIERVFNEGVTIITSPSYSSDTGEFIIYTFTPFGSDKILALAQRGLIFSDLVSDYKLWDTGNIFIIDEVGTIIADVKKDLVLKQRNYIIEADEHPDTVSKDDFQFGQFLRNVLATEKDADIYQKQGVDFLCSYKRITGSLVGWHVIVEASLNESQKANVQKGLLYSSLFLLFIGVILSILLSEFVSSPYKELEKLDANINAAAAKLEAIISNFSGIIWNVERNGNIALLNGLFIKNLGLTPSSYLGWNLDNAQKENENLKRIIMNVEETINKGAQDWVYENDGKVFHAHTVPIINDDGKVDSVVGVIDDISKITKLQTELEAALIEAHKANDAKSEFLTKMSHEMRTPLNAVIGLSALTLESNGLNAENHSNLEKIYNASLALLNTVNDILDISKIEAGKFELVPVEYDTPSLISDAIFQNTIRIGDKPIDFILEIDDVFPARLYGDDIRVKQILNNLLSNAFKYTSAGFVKLSMSSERVQEGNAMITIKVTDTGKGIKSENMDMLFSRYVNMDPLSNRRIEGTGLGLSIIKMVVDMMGGSIGIESEHGKGSIFTVKVKQQLVSDAVIGAEMADSLKSSHYLKPKRRRGALLSTASLQNAKVLVVDDVETNLEVAIGMMKPYGMQIDCVNSGQKAIDAIREEKVKYNAVFMDHMMPGLDGIEATRIIREEIGTEYARTVPIIALTANAIVGNEAMFLNNGFQAFISKPIEMERLDDVIKEWVQDISFNFNRGLEHFHGDKESYLQILKTYVANTRKLLETVKAVNPNNLADYAIVVHGIKGSSRGIYAGTVGDLAEALEKAAKSGDIDYVLKNNVPFIEVTGKLINDLEEILKQNSLENLKPKRDKLDPEVMKKLLIACDEFDMNGIDAAMAEINNFEYESDNSLAAWLEENVNQMNLQEIVDKFSALAEHNGA